MSHETIIALLGYAFVTSVTPGPNNFMLLASGVNFGFWRTIPHMFGISVGFFVLVVCVGLGIGAIFATFPALHSVLKIIGGAYLLYLAYRIATARSFGKAGVTAATPMTFLEAAGFQWVNPKAWVLALSATTVYSNPERPFFSVWLIAVTFAVVNFPSVSCWAVFGSAMRGFLADPVKLKWFNITMGVLLALTLWPMLR